MVRLKATYGKKPHVKSAFATDCFADTSSPIKPTGDECPQLPSPRIKHQHKRTAQTPQRSQQSDCDRDSQSSKRIERAEPNDALFPDSPAQNTRRRAALQTRDINVVANKLQRHTKPEASNDFSANSPPRSQARRRRSTDLSGSPPKPVGTSGAVDALAQYAAPLLSLASEATLTSFADYASTLSTHFNITKLAEASYGEVYCLSLLPSTSTHLQTSFSHTDESVLKLVALKPPSVPLPTTLTSAGKKRRKMQWTKAEQERIWSMSRVEDVSGEVRLLKRMSCVPGFTNFRALTVLRGPLPAPFLSAWHTYNDNVKLSEFPDPSSPGAYLGGDQLWAMIEMQDAGRDLEAVVLKSVWSVWDAFWGIAIAMAKGEEWARYEHRDLHLGNVCVKWDQTCTISDDINATPVQLHKKLGYTGLETTIIDYTLSRADMKTDMGLRPEPGSPSLRTSNLATQATDDNSGLCDVAYLDLSLDASLFEGDASHEYQYEIYRCMRSAVQFSDPLASSSLVPTAHLPSGEHGNRQISGSALWSQSHPLTNLVWLHFVLYKLCEGVEVWPSSSTKNNPLYSSRPVQKHAKAVEMKLSTLETVLALENMNRGPSGEPNGLCSASDLVAWAVEEAWLDEEDVVACGLGKGDLREEDTLLELVEALTVSDEQAPSRTTGKEHNNRGRRRRTKRVGTRGVD